MKKTITLLFLILSVFATSFAQTFKVQGVPRQMAQGSPAFSPTDATCDVDFAKIQRWVGEGDKQAALVIKWNDDKEPRLYVWGYRWTDDADATGSAMLCKVAESDPNFAVLIFGDTPYGDAIGGIGYDMDGDGFILKKGETAIDPSQDKTYKTTEYDFDEYSAGDPDDLWFSGWYQGYWSYWVCDTPGDSYRYSSVGATGRKLVDGGVDGWSAVRDMSNMNMGNMIGELYYLPELVTETTPVDYTQGTFIVNEDWYGHQNSTVNFITNDGEWYYRVIQKENPGIELGCTNQFGTIYGDKFYLIAKQEKDPGAEIVGGRITVCDAKTMKVLKQIQNISVDEKGNSNADGRGFLGVDEHKGYIGTSNGIFIFDLDNLEVKGRIEGSESGTDDPYGSLYSAQIGTMVRANDKVFAVHQSQGLLVINPHTDLVEQVIKAPETWGFGSVVMSKDGNLWLSLADPSGSGTADNRLVKINPVTLEQEIIECPEGIYGPANSWYAWTPDCFSASTQNNALYWNGGENSWFNKQMVFKYDIDTNEFSKFIDLTGTEYTIYGCSFRMHPVTDEAYVSMTVGNQFGNNTVLRTYDNTGTLLNEYPMITNYWFPSIPVFPDNEAPVAAEVSPVELTSGNGDTIALADVATDADNMVAAMVKSIKSISDETVLEAAIKDGNLVITALKAGQSDITLQINSNGKLAETVVSVTVTESTGIESVETEDAKVSASYTLDGKLLNGPRKGINIVRMSNGKIKKVIVK